jgi:hypothetical protein
MVVSPRAIHTFKNESTEDCEVYMTSSPDYYVDHFCMLSKATDQGKQREQLLSSSAGANKKKTFLPIYQLPQATPST